jgi:hypothetical protein
VEGGLDDFGGDGALAADAPVVAAKFDDGGRHEGLRFAGVEDKRDAVAELAENFVATGTGGRAGDVGAGAGERDTNFLDEASDNFASGPAKCDAASVAGNLQRKTHGGVENDGERAGPEGVGEAIEIVGKIARENVSVMDGADEKRKSFGFWATLNAEDFVDGGKIDGIGGESVERVGRYSDHRTAIKPPSGITDEARIGRIRAKL